jgi:hypothetical protein
MTTDLKRDPRPIRNSLIAEFQRIRNHLPKHVPWFRLEPDGHRGTASRAAPIDIPRGDDHASTSPGVLQTVRAILERRRLVREQRLFERYGAGRWTDSTERKVNNALMSFNRRWDPFERE